MAIATLDDYIGSVKQRVQWCKTASRTTIATFPYSLFDLAGQPGAGALAGISNTNGVVPTETTTGYTTINAYAGGAKGYISKVEYANTVAGWFDLYDRLFVAGAFSWNANTTLTSQPSYVGRLPNSDYRGLQIWVETISAPTGNITVNVGYTNENGTAGRSTGAVGIGGAPAIGRCWQLPLQAGDCGVQKIDTIVAGTATAGTNVFNVMVLRPLWSGRVILNNGGDVHDMLKTGLPEIYHDSALYVLFSADSTSSGVPELMIEVASK